jgi:hypothetical protein
LARRLLPTSENRHWIAFNWLFFPGIGRLQCKTWHSVCFQQEEIKEKGFFKSVEEEMFQSGVHTSRSGQGAEMHIKV